VDIGEALESAGIRREDVREVAVCAIFVIAVTTAYGLVVPTSITVMTFATFLETEDPTGSLLAGLGALLVGSTALAVVASVRLIERRWPWPLGSRITRPKATSPAVGRLMFLPALIAPLLDAAAPWWPIGPPQPATGSYFISDAPETWLRVVAPADFAYYAVVGIALWVAYMAAIVGVVAAWRGVRRRHAV
jgi:hypothetical protein